MAEAAERLQHLPDQRARFEVDEEVAYFNTATVAMRDFIRRADALAAAGIN
jgi:hypothetical protein